MTENVLRTDKFFRRMAAKLCSPLRAMNNAFLEKTCVPLPYLAGVSTIPLIAAKVGTAEVIMASLFAAGFVAGVGTLASRQIYSDDENNNKSMS